MPGTIFKCGLFVAFMNAGFTTPNENTFIRGKYLASLPGCNYYKGIAVF
jgi:hypothetical protein